MIISLTKHSALFGIRDGYLKHEPGDRILELSTISAYTVRRSGPLSPGERTLPSAGSSGRLTPS